MSLALRKGGSATGGSKAGSRSNALGYEVLLQEMLAKAGCDPNDPNPNTKRLACHMQLLQELHRTGAFGVLSGLMGMVIKELVQSLYTNEMLSDPLSVSSDSVTGGAMSRLPFFAALAAKDSQLSDIMGQADAIRYEMQGQAAREEALREEILVLKEKERSMQATMMRLEYEVAKAKQTVETTLEETELTRGKDQAAIKYLTEELNLANKEANAAIAENKLLHAREDVELRMRDQFANSDIDTSVPDDEQHIDVSGEVAVLIKQLLVLQNGRIEDFESRMAVVMAAAIPNLDQMEHIRELFAKEMNALHFEIKQLYAHQHALGEDEDSKNEGLDILPQGYDMDSDNDEEEHQTEAGESSKVRLSPNVQAMWQVFHVIAEGDKHLIHPMVPRICTEDDLHISIDRILLANYKAVCPYVKWRSDEHGPHPKGATFLPEDHPVDSSANVLKVASKRAILASEHVYKFLQDRYGCFQVAMMVGYSILKAVEIHQDTSPKVAMFGKLAGGLVDDAMWQYALQCQWLMENHPKAPQWEVNKMANFESFWKLLYPNQMDSEVHAAAQEIHKGHHGFSNGLVLNYIISRLLTKTEPRLRRWMKVLKWKDTSNSNLVFRNDIVSIAPKIFPYLNPKVVDSAFCMVAHKFGGDSVPLESMAYLACHLETLTISWPAQQ